MAKRKLNVLQPDGKRFCAHCNAAFDEGHFSKHTLKNGKIKYQCRRGRPLFETRKKKINSRIDRNYPQPDGRVYCGRCGGIFDKEHFTIHFYPNRHGNGKDVTQYICKKNDSRLDPNNPDRKYKSNWKHDPILYRKDVKLQREYGITLDYYNQLFKEQGGCCAICGKPQSELNKPLFVDHNHSTEETRGLLCGNCNTALGMLKEDISLYLKSIEYINKYNK